MGKIKFCGLLIGGLLFLMSSCLDGSDDDGIDDWRLSNAQISSFSLENDSIAGLSAVRFTIDQLNGKIFNKDSMPYGTALDRKLLCYLGWDSGNLGVARVLFVSQATGDSVWWTANDSIDFSAPVKIIVDSHDGISTKTYEAKLNVHQVDPDTMVWHKSNLIYGKTFEDMKVLSCGDSYYMYVEENDAYRLYITDKSDVLNWKEVSLSGFPDKAILSQITDFEGDLFMISESGELYCSTAEQNSLEEQSWSRFGNVSLKALLGYIPENKITGRSSVLSGIMEASIPVLSGVEGSNSLYFVSIDKNQSLSVGSRVPETFPLSGFGSLNYESMYTPRLVIASGRDSKDNLSDNIWSTLDALSWALLSNMSFTPREGAALSYYDNCFFVVGGIDASGAALNDIYYSKDHGLNWLDTGYVMAEEYTARGFASVVVDKNNYMMLFGGKAGKDNNVLNELWRGRINRLGFGKE